MVMRAIVLALIVSSPVVANENCDIFADVLFRIALERDNGISRREMRQRVITQVDDKLHDAFLALVDMAYKKPHLSPTDEADQFYKQCTSFEGQKTGVTF